MLLLSLPLALPRAARGVVAAPAKPARRAVSYSSDDGAFSFTLPPTWELIVDCSKLTFVSSAGLGVLLKANRQLGALGGQVHLAGVGGPVVQILRIARLDGILKLHEDVGRAKHALRRRS